jgi:indolepyruvate ferredoxin oxidoreductase
VRQGFLPQLRHRRGRQPEEDQDGRGQAGRDGPLPEPQLPACEAPYNILINGIGGTGVITVGALMGMAAHLEGKGASVLDMTGMSQKNGSVTSHVKIAKSPAHIRAQRIATGEADLILGCDMLTAGAQDAVSKMRPGRSLAVVNLHEQPPGTFAQNADWQYPTAEVRQLIEESVGGADAADFIDATKLATALMGDSIAANLFMLGYAWQKGRIPLTQAALLRAIELNGVGIESNKKSFLWGRRAAVDVRKVTQIATPSQAIIVQMPQSLDSVIKKRVEFLTAYQNAAYADGYLTLVKQVRDRENTLGLGQKLSMAVAKNYFKLLAYKDEYEVARLYTDGRFVEQLQQQFEGNFSVKFNLAPPLFAKKDAKGHLVKAEFGSWMWRAFQLLAKAKGLRGGTFDVFGYTAERKMERALIVEYRELLAGLLVNLTADNLGTCVELASLPEKIRGFGHVKEAAVDTYRKDKARLLAKLADGSKHAA